MTSSLAFCRRKHYRKAMGEGDNTIESKNGDRTPRGGWTGSWASIRDLEVLRAVIAQGGVTAAARSLSISQPAVSRTLSQLEERSGRSFFTRKGSQLVATAEAMRLYAATDTVFESLARIEEFRWLEPERERLSIVAAPTLGHCLLPQVLARFARDNPNITIQLDIQTSVDVVSAVASGQADIGIAEVPEGDWGVTKFPFRRSNLAVAMPKTHEWSGRPIIRADELQNQPLIVLLKRNPFRTMLDRLLWREGGLPNIVIETSDALSAVEHVEQGLGLAVVNPFPVMLQRDRALHYAMLEPSMVYETCVITNSAGPSAPGVSLLIESLKAVQAPDTALSKAVA